MADAWPQLARCFEAQWRGQPVEEQVRIAAAWRQCRLPASAGMLRGLTLGQDETLLWSVEHGPGLRALMSIKRDVWPREWDTT
ncbi:MAG: hypothetical protein HW395_48 [candidate division NC10 bacterium]|nr:hypothetical protein [candidate division NC10 bacterium]